MAYASRKSWFPIAVTVTVAVDSPAETIWLTWWFTSIND